MTSLRLTGVRGAPRQLVAFALAIGAASAGLALLAEGEARPRLPADVERAQASITQRDLRAAVTLLAGDALAGRGTGHAGNDEAARHVAAMLEAADLSPLDASGFLRPLDLFTPALGDGTRLAITASGDAGDGFAAAHAPGEHFQPVSDSPDADLTAEIVFAGFGIGAPGLGYDDYAGLDVSGRVVVAFEGTPTDGQGPDPLGGALGDLGSVRAKAEVAQARGASALLLVAPAGDRRLPALATAWPASPSVKRRRVHLRSRLLPLPVARLSRETVEEMLGRAAGDGVSLDALRSALVATATGAAASGALATSFPLAGQSLALRIELARTAVPAANVIGRIAGGDAPLRDQFVLVGAHFDHDGLDDQGRVYNGADDNASGTAGVLEVAQAFGLLAEEGRRPRRPVVFALWNGEEHGLLGSEAFAGELGARGERPVAVLNLDMIGRDEHVPPGDQRFAGLSPTPASRNRNALHVLGYSHSPDLMAIVREENEATRLTLRTSLDDNPQRLLRRSDQWPFLRARVPSLYFFTGLHPDYHTPDDDVEKLNFEKMVRIVRLAYRVAWRAADTPTPPSYIDPRPSIEP
ncbi:MAG: M20/M25/M40 family metallo-hydrolase [Vicinamibacterales bacterium]|nr:M20/M25/M40 family metallo-hydrolase [Vicinamibacterales bacterium]